MSFPEQSLNDFCGTERFQVQRRLGAGGFGVVYQVYDRKLESAVALTTLRRLDPASLYKFKKEFRIVADLRHRNLITFHELLAEADQWFFTMELVRGCTILDHVREGRIASEPLTATITTPFDHGVLAIGTPPSSFAPKAESVSVDRLTDAFTQLAEGVCALHNAKVLHRDLKPFNVLVTNDGRVVILDFGLAMELAKPEMQTTVHSIAGTPGYMAPEQAAGQTASEAADWYSFGVMLYEALTGSLPVRRWPPGPDDLTADPPSFPPTPSGTPPHLEALCRDLLRPAGVRPRGLEIIERLGGRQCRQPLAAPPPPVREAFVGRAAQLEALWSAYRLLQSGHGPIVRLPGVSGIGKTTLVRQFLRDLQQRDPHAVVLAGRCYEREFVPYKALDSVVDSITAYMKRLSPLEVERIIPRDVLALARLFPVLRSIEAVARARRRGPDAQDSQELRRRGFAAFRELFARLTDESPVVLFIDDFQWGDLDSAALLAELVRPPEPPPLLLILAYRSEDVAASAPLQSLLSADFSANAGAVVHLPVGPLSVSECCDLAMARLSHADTARADAIARESFGSPFFVDELARHVDEAKHAETPKEITLEEMLLTRISRLPAPARRFLEVAAVSGRPLDIDVVRRAAQLPPDDLATVPALRSAHFIRTLPRQDGQEVMTYHDRIRETVLRSLTPETLAGHHYDLATTLENAGENDPEILGVHFAAAGVRDKAASFTELAAERAVAALAFDHAAGLYRRAVDLASGDTSGLRQLLGRLAQALVHAGRGAEAAQTFLKAADGAPPTDALDLRRRAAEQLLIAGHIEHGLGILSDVLAAIGMRLPQSRWGVLASLLVRTAWIRIRGLRFTERASSDLRPDTLMRIDTCWSAACGLTLVDMARGAEFQTRHLLLALRTGEPHRVARAIAQELTFSTALGGRGERRTRQLSTIAFGLAEQLNDPYALGMATLRLGLAEFGVGKFRESLNQCDHAEAILREQGTDALWDLDTVKLFEAFSLYWMGEWKELAQRTPGWVDHGLARGDLYVVTTLRHQALTTLRLAADDPDGARAETLRAAREWTPRGYHLQHFLHFQALTDIELYVGDVVAARKYLDTDWPRFERSLLDRVAQPLLIISRYIRARIYLALAASRRPPVEFESRDQLLRKAARDARRIGKERMPWGIAFQQLLSGCIAATQGQTESAIELLRAAEATASAADMVVTAAVARRRRGELNRDHEGQLLVAEADAQLAAQGIKDPARIAAVFAPGRWS